MTTVHVTLSEALLGFSRVLITHLDGKGIKVSSPKDKVIKTGDSIILRGEGMPVLHPDPSSPAKGDLYVLFEIEMPTESWAATVDRKVSQHLRIPSYLRHDIEHNIGFGESSTSQKGRICTWSIRRQRRSF